MELDGGKYEVKREGHRTMVYRHGEFWREVTGDNLIFWMMARIEELESMQAPLMNNIQELIERAQRWGQGFDPECVTESGQLIDEFITTLESMQAPLAKKARAGDIRDDHCLTPDEYDGKARAGE